MLFLLVNTIGIGVAVAIWVYGLEIQAVNALRLQLASHLPRWFVLPLMGVLGGSIAGALISGVEPGAKGSGIVQVMLWLQGVPVPMGWRVAAVKLLASGVAIGGGIPVGPEGPSIQIGASLARESADRLSANDRQQRVAVAIGSGAGLAAVFHSPLGGVMYTIEELLKRSDVRTNAIAAFASFATIAWTRLLSAAPVGPAWLRELLPIIPYPSQLEDFRLVDVPILLVLGVLAGGLAVIYQRGILRMRLALRTLKLEAWQLLPLVGLVIGLSWSLLPGSFDNPDRLDFDALLGLSTPSTALLALGVQGIGTAVAVAAEAPGGFLAPALVVGASLGTLVQQLFLLLFSYAPATLLFAGGGAFLGALTRTPLTAILLTFELSKNYALLLPIGFAVLSAIAVADQLERLTLFDVMLEEANPGSR
jgi:CIC family chloride channel protein